MPDTSGAAAKHRFAGWCLLATLFNGMVLVHSGDDEEKLTLKLHQDRPMHSFMTPLCC